MNKFKNKIFLSIFAVLILVSGVLLFKIYTSIRVQALSYLDNELAIDSKQASNGIKLFFEQYKSGLSFLARIKEIKYFNKKGKSLLKKYYESNRTTIKAITRINSKGIIIYTYPYVKSVIGKDVSFQKHNSFIIRNHKPIVSDIFNTVQGYRAIAYAYPVFSDDGSYTGSITLLIPFYNIVHKYLRGIKIGENGYAWMISKGGTVLYSPTQNHIGKSIYPIFLKFPSLRAISDNMISGKKGSGKYNYYSTTSNKIITELVEYYPIKLDNALWSVAVSVPQKEITFITKEYRDRVTLVFISFFVALIILAYLFVKSKQKSEQKIREKDRLFKMASMETGQIIFNYDIITGKIQLEGNLEKIIGYKKEKFENFTIQDWNNLIHPDEKEKVISAFEKAQLSSTRFDYEYRFKCADGNYIFVETHGMFFKDKRKNIYKMIGTIKDITERKKAREELIKYKEKLEDLIKERTKQLEDVNKELQEDIEIRKKTEEELIIAKKKAEASDKLKSDFLAQISHEIRTPINTILNYVSLIKMDLDNYLTEDTDSLFTTINDAAYRLIRTIELILNVADVESGQYELRPQLTDISKEIIIPLINEFKEKVNEKGLELNYNIEKCKNKYYIDRYSIKEILSNLIDNAIKYTPRGKVDVRVLCEGKEIIIEVADTGIGISDKNFSNIFKKFRQEEEGYTRRFEGTGLGLALVKLYCELNKGEISFKSRKGKGSIFRLKLTPQSKEITVKKHPPNFKV